MKILGYACASFSKGDCFSLLPNELGENVLKFLSFNDLIKCTKTCNSLKDLVLNLNIHILTQIAFDQGLYANANFMRANEVLTFEVLRNAAFELIRSDYYNYYSHAFCPNHFENLSIRYEYNANDPNGVEYDQTELYSEVRKERNIVNCRIHYVIKADKVIKGFLYQTKRGNRTKNQLQLFREEVEGLQEDVEVANKRKIRQGKRFSAILSTTASVHLRATCCLQCKQEKVEKRKRNQLEV